MGRGGREVCEWGGEVCEGGGEVCEWGGEVREGGGEVCELGGEEGRCVSGEGGRGGV